MLATFNQRKPTANCQSFTNKFTLTTHSIVVQEESPSGAGVSWFTIVWIKKKNCQLDLYLVFQVEMNTQPGRFSERKNRIICSRHFLRANVDLLTILIWTERWSIYSSWVNVSANKYIFFQPIFVYRVVCFSNNVIISAFRFAVVVLFLDSNHLHSSGTNK